MCLSFSISRSTVTQVMVDKLVKDAYGNWESVSEYDSESLVSEPAYKHTSINNESEGMVCVGSSSGHEEQPLMYNSMPPLSMDFQSLPTTANTTGKMFLLRL